LVRAKTNLSACALAVKHQDRDRWFCSLFAPEDRREDLYALYAFNAELARVADKVSEPLLGEIRLQWWREAIEGLYGGQVRQHDVVLGLDRAIARHELDRGLFGRLIDARAADLEAAPPQDLAALDAYARETSVPLMQLALGVLGVRDGTADAAAETGATGYALVGLLRATSHLLAAGRILLPAATMVEARLGERDLRAGRGGVALADTARPVAELARRHIGDARALAGNVPRRAIAALLPVALAASDLERLARLDYDVLDPRIAERRGGRLLSATWRALSGRY